MPRKNLMDLYVHFSPILYYLAVEILMPLLKLNVRILCLSPPSNQVTHYRLNSVFFYRQFSSNWSQNLTKSQN